MIKSFVDICALQVDTDDIGNWRFVQLLISAHIIQGEST